MTRNTTPDSRVATRRLRPRSLIGAMAIALAAAGLAGFGTASASAEGIAQLPAASATDGWMRVAHLSPDTRAVNVTLTALTGGQKVVELDNVSYGAVSQYIHLPSGTYVVAMTPWTGTGSANSRPMISASVNIVQGKTITIAAFGANRKLTTRVFQDDLTSPTGGQARIRLIQASTTQRSVNVATSSGIQIADNAQTGQATSYASVPAGPWTLDLTAKKVKDTSEVQLAQGSVTTLFVLDNAGGGLTVKPVLDSASVGQDPVGGVNTGGGWAAESGLLTFSTPARVGDLG